MWGVWGVLLKLYISPCNSSFVKEGIFLFDFVFDFAMMILLGKKNNLKKMFGKDKLKNQEEIIRLVTTDFRKDKEYLRTLNQITFGLISGKDEVEKKM